MFKWKRALLFLIAVSFLGYFVIKEGASSSSKKANARSQWSWVLSQTVADDGDSPEEEDESADVCVDCNGDGFVGDGRVRVTCSTCNGTGRKVTKEACSFVSSEEPATCDASVYSGGRLFSLKSIRTKIRNRSFRPVRSLRNKIRCR